MRASAYSLASISELCGIPAERITAPLEEQRVQLAWISGSIVENLGNPSSDIDVFAVLPELPQSMDAIKKSDDHFTQVYFSNSRRLDFEYWSAGALLALQKKLESAPVGLGTKNILDYFAEHEVEFIHRLHIGVPILGESEFQKLLQAYPRQQLLGYLVDNKRIYIDDAFDDTVGLMREGHLLSAAYRARYTLELSADMLLYAHGISNHKEKHRYRLLSRLLVAHPQVRPFYQEFLDLTAHLPLDLVALQEYIARCLYQSESLVRYALSIYEGNSHA